MADNLTIIQHRHLHARGQQVAGVGGRLYEVHIDNGLLHEVVDGIVSAQPGCSPECAARFAHFSDTFRRQRPAPPTAPSPSPSPAPTGGTVEGSDGPAVETEASEPLSEVDLSILDGSVGSLIRALATGEHDEHLSDLMAAEESGKTRKSAVAAIRDRQDGLED